MVAHPTTEWSQLQSKFYRKTEIYSMSWRYPDFNTHIVVAAPHAGLLAIIRDDRKLQVLGRNQSTKPVIYIYTATGLLLDSIDWKGGRVINMGWTIDERLVIVNNTGSVFIYTLYGSGSMIEIGLGKLAKEHGIIDCKIWNTGLVALSGNFKLITIMSFSNEDEMRPRLMADPAIDSLPKSWTVIPPQVSMTRHPEVIIATTKTVKISDLRDTVDQGLHEGPFIDMAVSPNGKFVALYSTDGKVWVVSSDFQNNLSESIMNREEAPTQLVWCGGHSVVLSWEDELVMVGPFGETLRYIFDDSVWLSTSIDGLLFFTREKCGIIEKVQQETEDTFNIGSTAPSAMLLDASEHFDNKSPKADKHIRILRKGEKSRDTSLLKDAVDTCILAAGREFSQFWQKKLLRAVSFGKSFLENYDVESYLDMCKMIRVMNALRDRDIGMPITYEQYLSLGTENIIQRLIGRHQHFLAYKICQYLKLRPEPVLVQWAQAKIQKSTDDEETLCRVIVGKLNSSMKQNGGGGISFSEISKTAIDIGQPKLATRLLDYEARAGEQVPLLLTMSEYNLALNKAIESGDPDLLHSVLLHLRKYISLAEFFRCVNDKPKAIASLEAWCETLSGASRRQNRRRRGNEDDDDMDIVNADRELLRDFYYQDDRRVSGAMLALEDAREVLKTDVNSSIGKLKIAAKLLHDEGKTDPQRIFDSKALEDATKLLNLQQTIEAERTKLDNNTGIKKSIIGMSLSETISELLTWGYNIGGDKSKISEGKWVTKWLCHEFKVPDKRYWWIKLRALINARDWDGVDRFGLQGSQISSGSALSVFGGSSTKKGGPPIGYKAFAIELIKAKQINRAKTWITKCEAVNERVELWIRIGDWRMAGQEAFGIKDGILLRHIRERCPNGVISAEMDGLLAQLK